MDLELGQPPFRSLLAPHVGTQTQPEPRGLGEQEVARRGRALPFPNRCAFERQALQIERERAAGRIEPGRIQLELGSLERDLTPQVHLLGLNRKRQRLTRLGPVAQEGPSGALECQLVLTPRLAADGAFCLRIAAADGNQG
jgi:hypothetical protein